MSLIAIDNEVDRTNSAELAEYISRIRRPGDQTVSCPFAASVHFGREGDVTDKGRRPDPNPGRAAADRSYNVRGESS
ncbi:hypothetical protein ACTMTI_04625 [Nonomuraea sp. H19]|uniref:hypothetical protein n=1 Tax=Nonomuraea sp. H19 TaxID=3452206 RepID=UPI003F8A66E7